MEPTNFETELTETTVRTAAIAAGSVAALTTAYFGGKRIIANRRNRKLTAGVEATKSLCEAPIDSTCIED